MTDRPILDHINALANEEGSSGSAPRRAAGSSTADQERLDTIKVELDRCYDLLHQRQARRDAGLDPEQAELRPAEVVERYQQ